MGLTGVYKLFILKYFVHVLMFLYIIYTNEIKFKLTGVYIIIIFGKKS